MEAGGSLGGVISSLRVGIFATVKEWLKSFLGGEYIEENSGQLRWKMEDWDMGQ